MNTKRGNLSDSELMEIAAKRIKQLEREADSKGFKSYKKYGGLVDLWMGIVMLTAGALGIVSAAGDIIATVSSLTALIVAMIMGNHAQSRRDNGIILERLEEIEEKL